MSKVKVICILSAIVLLASLTLLPQSSFAISSHGVLELKNLIEDKQSVNLLTNEFGIAESIIDEENSDELSKTEKMEIGALENKIASEKEILDEKSKEIEYDYKGQSVDVDKSEPDKLDVSFASGDETDENNFTVNLPLEDSTARVIDDVIIANDGEDDYSVTTEIFDGGIRNCFIIKDSSAPELYPIEYDFDSNDVELEFVIGEDGEKDGTIVAKDKDGEILMCIAPPWAKDSDGNDMVTYYEITGNTVTQIVKHKGENISYPIVADPTIGNNFSNYKWIYRSGDGYTFSLYPTTFLVRMLFSQNHYAIRTTSWIGVYNKGKTSSHWKNTAGMKDQYLCHLDFAARNSTYNLDPWRPNVSYLSTVLNRCNP
jgi:hypothetical protein